MTIPSSEQLIEFAKEIGAEFILLIGDLKPRYYKQVGQFKQYLYFAEIVGTRKLFNVNWIDSYNQGGIYKLVERYKLYYPNVILIRVE